MIQLSEEAAKEVKRLQEENEDLKDYYLRISCSGGGCSGILFALGFDKQKLDSDLEFEEHNIKIICDNKSHIYADGSIVEFSKELIGGGFRILNNNAKTQCGCGKSFSF